MKAAICLPSDCLSPSAANSPNTAGLPTLGLLNEQLQSLAGIGVSNVILICPQTFNLRQQVVAAYPSLWFTWLEYEPQASTHFTAMLSLLYNELNEDLIWLDGRLWLAQEVYVALKSFAGRDMLLVSHNKPAVTPVAVQTDVDRVVRVGGAGANGPDDYYWTGAVLLSGRNASFWQSLLSPDEGARLWTPATFEIFDCFAAHKTFTALDIGPDAWYQEQQYYAFIPSHLSLHKTVDYPVRPPRPRLLFCVVCRSQLPLLQPVYAFLRRETDYDLAFAAAPSRTLQNSQPGRQADSKLLADMDEDFRIIDDIGDYRPHLTVVAEALYDLPDSGKIVNIGPGLISKGLFYTRAEVVRRDNQAALLCVPGEYHREVLSQNVFVPIRVTGFVGSDALFGPGACTRQAFCEQYAIPADKRIVLYAPTFNDELSSIPCLGTSIAQVCTPECVLIIKLHPRTSENSENVVARYRELAREQADVHLIEVLETAPALAAADLLISDVSSVIVEAMTLDIPVIVYENPDTTRYAHYRSDDIEYQVRDACLVVATPDELRQALQTALANPTLLSEKRRIYARSLNYGRDGKSAQRVGRAIIQLVEGGFGPTEKRLPVDGRIPQTSAPAVTEIDASSDSNTFRIAATADLSSQTSQDEALEHNDQGVQCYQQGDYDQARHHYERAVQLDSGNALFQKNLADFYYVVDGRAEAALAIYHQIREQNPGDSEALLTLGHVYAQQGDFAQAQTFYHQVLGFDSEQAEARQALSAIAREVQAELPTSSGRWPEDTSQARTEAVSSFDDSQIQADHPGLTDWYAHFQKALANGNQAAAREALEQLLRETPNDALVHNDLAVLLHEAGREAEALRHYERAVQLEPDNPVFQKNLAEYYYAVAGRPQEALTLYEALLEKFPEDCDAMLVKGHILVTQGDLASAQQCYEQILTLDATSPEARHSLEILAQQPQAANDAVMPDFPADPDGSNISSGISRGDATAINPEPAFPSASPEVASLSVLWLVHHSGAVGAESSVLAWAGLLKNAKDDVSLYQTRLLNPRSLEAPPEFMPKSSLLVSRFLRRILDRDSENRQLRIITLVRDPFERNLLWFLENLPVDVAASALEGENREKNMRLLQGRFLEEFDFTAQETWLDEEVYQVFGFDLLSQPFDFGRSCLEVGDERIKLLLLRREDVKRAGLQVLQSFLETDHLKVAGKTVAETLGPDDAIPENMRAIYQAFLSTAHFSGEFLNSVYAGRVAQHFYTPEELAQFSYKWRR